jgi:Pyruvate/2-oxoacid:ferredoxin oxidoreductase gamma subunit
MTEITSVELSEALDVIALGLWKVKMYGENATRKEMIEAEARRVAKMIGLGLLAALLSVIQSLWQQRWLFH